MQFIDLSREIYHRTPTHPSHPPGDPRKLGMTITRSKRLEATRFSSEGAARLDGDHAGTHIDALAASMPIRPRIRSIRCQPRKLLYRGAICLDLSHAPLRHRQITVAEAEEGSRQGGAKRSGHAIRFCSNGRQRAALRHFRATFTVCQVSARRYRTLVGRTRGMS